MITSLPLHASSPRFLCPCSIEPMTNVMHQRTTDITKVSGVSIRLLAERTKKIHSSKKGIFLGITVT